MTELSYIAKIKQALELANKAKTGCSLTLFDVIELKGYIESLEETIALSDNEPANSDVSTEDALLKRVKKAEAEVTKLTAEIKKILEEAVFIKFENEDMLPLEIPDDVYSAAFDCSHVDGVRLFPLWKGRPAPNLPKSGAWVLGIFKPLSRKKRLSRGNQKTRNENV